MNITRARSFEVRIADRRRWRLKDKWPKPAATGYINSCPDNCDTYFDELRPYYPGKETLGRE